MTAPPLFQITFAVEGVTVVDRVLAGIETRASDLRGAWPDVVRAFQAVIARAFDTEGASTGAPWPELAPSTQRDRARHGFPPAHPILQRTQQLKRALTLGDGAAVVTTPISMRYVLAPEIAEKFWPHQSAGARAKLPRRAPVLLTEDDKHAIVRPIRLWITGHDPSAPQRSPV
jgi:hypothetical protein